MNLEAIFLIWCLFSQHWMVSVNELVLNFLASQPRDPRTSLPCKVKKMRSHGSHNSMRWSVRLMRWHFTPYPVLMSSCSGFSEANNIVFRTQRHILTCYWIQCHNQYTVRGQILLSSLWKHLSDVVLQCDTTIFFWLTWNIGGYVSHKTLYEVDNHVLNFHRHVHKKRVCIPELNLLCSVEKLQQFHWDLKRFDTLSLHGTEGTQGGVCWGQWHVHLSDQESTLVRGGRGWWRCGECVLTKPQTVTCCGLHDHGTERSGYTRQPHQEEKGNQKSSKLGKQKKPREAEQQKRGHQGKWKSLLWKRLHSFTYIHTVYIN